MSNNSLAFVFPGQGSQSVGMLAKLAELSPVVRATFDEASKRAGLRPVAALSARARRGSQRHRTHAARDAGRGHRHLASVAGTQGATPAVVTGHSLGEFTALVAAGAIDFATCVDLVRFRGQVMQEAVPAGTGAMAALLGLEDAEVEAACAEAAQGGGVVEAVNFNSPGPGGHRRRKGRGAARHRNRQGARRQARASNCRSACRRTAA